MAHACRVTLETMLRLVCLSVLLTGILASSSDLLPGRSSLLLWSNQAIVGNGQGTKVVYKVLDNVQEATSDAIIGLTRNQGSPSELLLLKDQVASSATTTIIFAGSQLGAEELRRGEASRLNSVLDSATSSLVVPHVSGKTCPMEMLKTLEGSGLTVQAIGCKHHSEDLIRDFTEVLSTDSAPQVLLVCPSPADHSATKQEALDNELDQLLAMQEAVDASGTSHLFIYMSHKQSSNKQVRRELATAVPLTGFRDYVACGALCQTQVRWLEGMLAVLFMALAVCSGLTCLNVLNTPTRFEVVKEGSTQ